MIYGAFNTKTGLIEVKILDGGDSVSTEIIDIGKLKYEFDLLPDGPEVDAVQALYNKISITIFQYAHTKEDLYDRLLANVVAQEGVKVEVVVDGDVFQFFIRIGDIQLSETERTISLDCRVLIDESKKALEVFADIQTAAPTLLVDYKRRGSDSDTLQATGVHDWINYAMKGLFLNDYDAVINSGASDLAPPYSLTNYTSFVGGIPDNDVVFCMLRMEDPPFGGVDSDIGDQDGEVPIDYFGDNIFISNQIGRKLEVNDQFFDLVTTAGQVLADVFEVEEVLDANRVKVFSAVGIATQRFVSWKFKKAVRTDTIPAAECLKELAAIEGSIFGTGFGKNFFVHRLQTQDIVFVDWQEVMNFDVEAMYNPIAIKVQQLAKNITNIRGGGPDYDDVINPSNLGIWPKRSGNYSAWKVPYISDAIVQTTGFDNAEKSVALRLAPGYPFFNRTRWFEGNDALIAEYLAPNEWYYDFEPVLALCRSGLDAIARSLFGEGEGIVIEFEIFGAKSIKPWNLIRLSGAPDKYRKKAFRPTTLEYDFVMDTVKVIAYETRDTFNQEVVGIAVSSGSVVFNTTGALSVQGESISSGSVGFKTTGTFDVRGESISSGSVTYTVT